MKKREMFDCHLFGEFIHFLVHSPASKGTRGTALVVAPEISSRFTWEGLMHGADWLPTIVEGVAGIRTVLHSWVRKKLLFFVVLGQFVWLELKSMEDFNKVWGFQTCFS